MFFLLWGWNDLTADLWVILPAMLKWVWRSKHQKAVMHLMKKIRVWISLIQA